MRPGKPLMFGRLGATPVLGLPGNPVSAFIGAVLFLLPALARLRGLADAPLPLWTARTGMALRANDRRFEFLRARLEHRPDGLVVSAFPSQDSAVQSLLAEADALILRPPHAPALEAGGEVEVIRLDLAGA